MLTACPTKEKLPTVTILLVLIVCLLYIAPLLGRSRHLKVPTPRLAHSSPETTEAPPVNSECHGRGNGSNQTSEYFLDLRGCSDSAQSPTAPNTTKLILAWTLSYGTDKWFGLRNDADYAKVLSGSGCTFTRDKSLVSIADMVLFHSCFFNRTGFHYPTTRRARQLYVYLTTEAPTSLHCRNSFIPLDGMFNITATYKLDSDLIFSYSPMLRSRPEADNTTLDRASNKTALAFWYMSDCYSDWSSKRQQYVKELKKYMSVDVYGSCRNRFPDSQRSCPKSDDSTMDKCFLSQSKKYKFYLAFENAICKDYITEKLFKILQPQSDVVPVVMGPSVADYEKVAPRGSFIHVKNFTGPKALAVYLKYLDGNDEAYNAYHAWRSKFYYEPLPGRNSNDQHPPSQLQKLCRLAHDPPGPKVWDRLVAWYSIEDNCQKGRDVCNDFGICPA